MPPVRAVKGEPHSAALRSAIHLAALALAFPLTYLANRADLPLGRAWAAGACLFLVAFNLLLLPRLTAGIFGRTIKRAGEGFVSGIWTYPLGLSLAFLLYPPFAVAAAWAVLAAGDAAAVTVGSRLKRPVLSWNPQKSWAGLLAFFVAAAPACGFLLWWCPDPLFQTPAGVLKMPLVWTLCVIAALGGAILESLEGPFDDNLRLSLGVGLLVWLSAFFLAFGIHRMPPARPLHAEWFLHALLANAVLVGAVLWLRFSDAPGALGGGMLGTLVYFFARPPGYALLILFVAGGSLLSRMGRAAKEARGAAEARGGQRGLANVLANLSVPAACCAAYPAFGGHPAALLAFAGALSAAWADTAASEIGALSRRLPRLITSGRRVPHGTNGAVSSLGYLAAAGAGLVFSGVAWGGGFWHVLEAGHGAFQPSVETGRGLLFSITVIAAGLFGTTVDSVLGARFEGRVKGLGKGAVNFLCSACGAALATAIGLYLW